MKTEGIEGERKKSEEEEEGYGSVGDVGRRNTDHHDADQTHH